MSNPFLLLLLWVFFLFFLFFLYIWVESHPSYLFTPLNSLLRRDKIFRPIFYSPSDCLSIFPVSQELKNSWSQIYLEGHNLFTQHQNKNRNILNEYSLDLGEENKENWTLIPLRLFGQNADKNIQQCPCLGAILKDHEEIVSCLFSVMSPGKIIKPHKGPYDGILHYQLALHIPQNTNTCYLQVENETYAWENGQDIMFDETYTHSAYNLTDEYRMVLLIDVCRPYVSKLYRDINKWVIRALGLAPATKRALLV